MQAPPYPAPFRYEDRFREYLKGLSGVPTEPTGCDRSLYLDLAERIVREAVKWQDESGRIIDPNLKVEWNHCSPRYASSVGPLIRAGRCVDLLDSCVRNIDAGIHDLVEGRCKAPDFTPRDLCLAIECIQDRVGGRQVTEWRRLLGSYDPQKVYTCVTSKKKPEDMHNFGLYNLTGEQMKRHMGAADNAAFIEEHLAIQCRRFSSLGMYRDPGCPMTYDLTDRQNLVLLMNHGYDGAHRPFLDEMLRRGGLTQLFYQSTTGEAPFGGRSNQFHHMEAMFACNAEFEASRYARIGSRCVAGVFKRAARRAALSTKRWILDTMPFRHVKNMFAPDTLHGCDSYGHYAVYSLLASNLFAYAALIADDSIPECAAPCDVGGYALPINDGFHRVFASCGPIHVAIDTCGQPGYDATGLCRLHHRAKPSELALSLGIVSKPHYTVTEPAHSACVAIGPIWRQAAAGSASLADSQPLSASTEIIEEGRTRVAFRITYALSSPVTEEYLLTPDALDLTVTAPHAPTAITVPLVLTDGQAVSEIQNRGDGFMVSYRDARLRAQALEPAARYARAGVRAPNRNGVYDVGLIETGEHKLTVRLSFP